MNKFLVVPGFALMGCRQPVKMGWRNNRNYRGEPTTICPHSPLSQATQTLYRLQIVLIAPLFIVSHFLLSMPVLSAHSLRLARKWMEMAVEDRGLSSTLLKSQL
jgi:hypothetical protein